MASNASAAPPRPRRYRRPDLGVFGGVCAGLAEYLRVDVRVVRLVAVMLACIGGIGVALYALAWALTPADPESASARRSRQSFLEAVLIVFAFAAILVVLRHAGVPVGRYLLWPLVVGVAGAALVWRPAAASASGGTAGVPSAAGPAERMSWREQLRGPRGRIDFPRLTVGALLVTFAVASLLRTAGVLRSLGDAIGAVAVVATAVGLMIGPLIVRLGRSLASERSARIREQERAELAAHLHDSVLQTLALIQKRADDPKEVAALARRQERDLRNWLFEPRDGTAGDSVRAALERAVAEVEELHGVPIEAVIVGDQPLDARLDALVPAAREALTNAAKFAGSDRIDLYAEIDERRAELYVRDRGRGFELDQVPDDRHGLRDSIVARLERHGGQAVIRTAPGEGTEVALSMEGPRA